MLRSLFASLMILLAVPACAGSRLGDRFHSGGFHGGGFRVFHHRRHAHRFFFGGYLCGFNCGWGFDNEVYDYGDGDGNGYRYGNAYSYGHGYSDGYANGYRGGTGNAVSGSKLFLATWLRAATPPAIVRRPRRRRAGVLRSFQPAFLV
jgi:hypothetical protein